MTRIRFFLFLSFIVLFLTSLPIGIYPLTTLAQNRDEAKRILRWLPMREYRELRHKDIWKFEKGEASDLFYEIIEYQGPYLGPLPPSLAKGIESQTTAVFSKCSIEEFTIPTSITDEREQSRYMRQKYPNSRMTAFSDKVDDEGNKLYYSLNEDGYRFYINSYLDLDSVVSVALKKGDLKPAEHSIRDLPVYEVKKSERKGSLAVYDLGNYLALPTPEGDMLFAGNIEDLREMYLAGLGEVPDILEENDSIDLLDIIPELGFNWSIDFGKLINRMNLELSQRAGREDKDLRSIESNVKMSPLLSASCWLVEDDIIRKTIHIFEDRSGADKYASRPGRFIEVQARAKTPESRKLKEAILKALKIEKDGLVVTSHTVYGEDILALKKAALKERLRRIEKYQKKQAEEEAKKKSDDR